MCGAGGRPPQAWLAAHEVALLNANARAPTHEALSYKGWVLLLECYSRLVYRASADFAAALELYFLAVLPDLGPQALTSLACSAARMKLPLSLPFKTAVTTRLEQVLPRATSEELQQLIHGALLLGAQLPVYCLRSLCDAAQPHLATFSPNATCSLLQLLAVAEDFTTSTDWLAAALSSLQPKLPSLEAPAALLLLQSLTALRFQPPAGLMAALQQRLLQLVPEFDAAGVATLLQGLVACCSPPSAGLQEALAGHIKKGLPQTSQGMGATPVWHCLEALLAMQQPAASPLLLDELLHQAAQQLHRSNLAHSREMPQTLLPRLAAAITAGGVWGSASGYAPSPEFCSALCCATSDNPSRLPPALWLDLLVRFGDVAAGKSRFEFKPSESWCRVATQQVFGGWGQQQQQQWASAPAAQLAALLGALGRLQHVPGYLPGWPDHALQQLSDVMAGLTGHQASVALLGIAQQQAMAELADVLAAAAAVQGSSSTSNLSSSSTSTTIGSSTNDSRDEAQSSSSSSSFAAARLQLLEAAEAATLPKLSSTDGNDLAVLAHALQQLGASPNPAWVAAWSAAAAAQLSGMSGQACVLLLSAAAAFQGRPDPAWVQLVLQRCQQQLPELQLQELGVLARSLQQLGYRLDQAAALRLERAGQARAAAPLSNPAAAAVSAGLGRVGSDAGEEEWEAAARRRELLELQQTLARIAGAA